jgi:hypothetical protein
LNLTANLLELALTMQASHGITVCAHFFEGDELAASALAGYARRMDMGAFRSGTLWVRSHGKRTGLVERRANEKAGQGLYDDILTFASDGSYVFDPGTGGTIYCNWECGFHSELWDGVQNNDYQVPVEKQTATFQFADGLITWPANTFVSYIPNAATLANPVYRISKMTPYIMELVTDNGAIAWHYRFRRSVN